MEIKAKLYPYPVLSHFSDDYKAGEFDVSIDVVRDGYNLKIDFLTTLTSTGLKNIVKAGQAQYVYHLECAQTGFRTVVKTTNTSESYVISNKSISGKLQICPFIVASQDIQRFSTPDFHNDYSNISFDIEAGCVMAVGKMVTVDISKDIDDLANTPSIFSIVRNADVSCKEMLVDMSGRKIIIKLPMSDYYSYKSLSQTPAAQAILNSLTIIPALTYVLSELKIMTNDERMENADSLWYKTLSKTLLTQFECDIESDDFSNSNSIVLAQKLINDPISDAFQMLTSGFGTSGGDDE